MKKCQRFSDHTSSIPMANGGCRHKLAESMSRPDFGRLPIVRCTNCKTVLGRICPECKHYY